MQVKIIFYWLTVAVGTNKQQFDRAPHPQNFSTPKLCQVEESIYWK